MTYIDFCSFKKLTICQMKQYFKGISNVSRRDIIILKTDR